MKRDNRHIEISNATANYFYLDDSVLFIVSNIPDDAFKINFNFANLSNLQEVIQLTKDNYEVKEIQLENDVFALAFTLPSLDHFLGELNGSLYVKSPDKTEAWYLSKPNPNSTQKHSFVLSAKLVQTVQENIAKLKGTTKKETTEISRMGRVKNLLDKAIDANKSEEAIRWLQVAEQLTKRGWV